MDRYGLKYLYRYVCDIIIVFLMSATFSWIWYTDINPMMDRPFENKGNWLVLLVCALLVIICFYIFEGFTIGVNRISHAFLSQAISIVIVNIGLFIMATLMVGRFKKADDIALYFLKLTGVDLLLLIIISYITTKLYRKIFPPYRVIAIYGDNESDLTNRMSRRGDKYKIAMEMHYKSPENLIRQAVIAHEAVLINDIPSEARNDILKICFEENKRVYFTPKIGDIFVKNSSELHIFDTPLYFCRNDRLSPIQRFVKRLMDIMISLVGIIITSPIMIITAIVIFCYDRGPVCYRQKRCTIDGRVFTIYKFRSMIVEAESDGRAVLAQVNDSRITPVGKFIRATRIDELPQFFNILRGDMSVVGPRPERPEIIQKYKKTMPEFDYRLRVKAGLTGYAQIYGKYNTTSYDKLKLDMMYVNNCSIAVDLRLILLTLRVILQKEAADGLKKGKTDAASGKGKG